MRVLSEILDSTPMGYYLSFHIVYRIDKASVYGTFKKIILTKHSFYRKFISYIYTLATNTRLRGISHLYLRQGFYWETHRFYWSIIRLEDPVHSLNVYENDNI